MIHFDRSLVTIPESLKWANSPPTIAYREFELAKEFFAPENEEARRQKRFSFEVYKRPEVRIAVGKVFFEKCAFCDRRSSSSNPAEVDMFRPKSAVTERPDHPGYWWLAMKWENMLLACADCSRTRDSDGIKTGKANRFPLLKESERAFKSDDENYERPLLLDPCKDDPEEHFIYDLKTGVMSSVSERGNTTIAVLGLNRPDLTAMRMLEATLNGSIIYGYAKAALDKAPSDIFRQKSLEELRKLGEPDQDFAGMKREMIKPFLDGTIGPQAINALGEMFGTKSPFYKQFRTGGQKAKPSHRAIKIPGTDKFVRSRGLGKTYSAMLAIEAEKKLKRKAVQQTKKFEHSQASYSLTDKKGLEKYRSQRRLIEHISIRNIKAIRELDLSLTSQGGRTPWHMLLGENGTGKSSLLQATALVLLGHQAFLRLAKECGLHPKDYLRYGCKQASVQVKLSGFPRPHKLVFREDRLIFTNPLRKKTTIIFTDSGTKVEGAGWEPQCLLLGYGATRLLPRKQGGARPRKLKDFSRVNNLFDPFMPLIDAEKWLLKLDQGRFDNLAVILKDLISLKDSAELVPEGGQVVVVDNKARVPLRRLSDGYQSMVAMTIDILEVALLIWPNLQEAEGIILLDELGAHLHPTWKMKVVGSLRKALPAMQFVVTTHDPLCLRGLGSGEVAVMRRDENSQVFALTDLPSPDDLRIDQLLTSDYFGLNSTAEPDTQESFDNYYALLTLPSLTPEQQQEFNRLQEKLKGRRQLGETLRENLMFEAIDKLVAAHRINPRPLPDLQQAALEAIEPIWGATDLTDFQPAKEAGDAAALAGDEAGEENEEESEG